MTDPDSNNGDIARVGIIKSNEIKTRNEIPSLFLNEQTSLSRLITLFYERTVKKRDGTDVTPPSLVQFNLDPEYYVILKKPFRVSLAGSTSPNRYLLIRDVRSDMAFAMDSNGNDRIITRDFILRNWGGTVSWLYPQDNLHPLLYKGMRSRSVLELQEILNRIGYMVKLTGIYDESTIQGTMRFQKDFNLSTDGIAGPMTRSLLYQMVQENELY